MEKKNLINRLKRIEGQIRGLQGMIDDERCCDEVLTQLSAVTSALHKVGEEIVKDYTKNCLAEYREKNDEQLLDELIESISKFRRI